MERHDAYTALLGRYRTMVRRMCMACARGNRERSRDLMQEVSIALWLHFDQLRPGSTPQQEKAWVRWLTRSTLDHLQRGQQPVMQPLTAALADSLADGDTVNEKETVDEVLAALSPDEQRIMRLRLDGYPADEIAEQLGIGRNAVYQRVYRAMSKARRVLLAVLFTCVLTVVAVAVVPQWREVVLAKPDPEGQTPLTPSEMAGELPQDSVAVADSLPSPVIDVVWSYEGWNREGWSVTYCYNDSSISFTRYTGNGTVTATARDMPAIIWNDTLIPDSMNTALKTAALSAVMMALTTATQAQVAYDFKTVTPQGDTLLCTVTDSVQQHISVRGSEYMWNASTSYSDTLVIPQTIEYDGTEYTVTALGDSAFRSHNEIHSIVLPPTLTNIGIRALDVAGIVELAVPDGVQSIGQRAFRLIKNVVYHGSAEGAPWGALTLNGYTDGDFIYADSTRTRLTGCRPEPTQVDIPASVQVIGPYAFFRTNVCNLTLPEGLDTIGESAFQGCDRMASIVIPSTVRSIGAYSFYSAFRSSGTVKVTITDAECAIGRGAFYCSNITGIDLGNSVTSLDRDAFASLSRCDSIIVPNSCTYIAPRVFCYNYSGRLKKVRLPEGIDTIGAELFHGCVGLREVNIPSSVVYIDSMAFLECLQLREVILPAGLTYIGDYGFAQCSRVETFVSLAAVPPQACPQSFLDMPSNIILTVPCGSGLLYESDPNWSYFELIDEDCGAVSEVQQPEAVITSSHGSISVDAPGEKVAVFDLKGRQLASAICHGTYQLRLPAGVYLVQVGTRPPRKVIVME